MSDSSQPSNDTPCPLCGSAMEIGYLLGPRGLRWSPSKPTGWDAYFAGLIGELMGRRLSMLGTFAKGTRCKSCRKIIVDC